MKAMQVREGRKKEAAVSCWVTAFIVNLAVALAAVVPFLIVNRGYMAMSHDFSAQEIAFNMLMNDTVKSGNLLWNWGIDLGGNFLETFSFYNVGSVFFWLLLLFPAGYTARVMGWMIILKYAVAGAVSAAYLERHVKDRTAVVFASLLYTFSGFQCGTVVFYHFQDVVAFFPLMLIGLELLVEEKKRGRLLFSCVLNLFCNYVFFVGEVLFLVAYYVVKYLIPELKSGGKNLLKRGIFVPIFDCMLEGAIGTAVAGVILIPSICGTLMNSRVSSHLLGNAWFSMSTADWLLLLKAALTPAEPMNFMSVIPGADWMSNMAYLPMVGLLFVLAYAFVRKDWISTLLKLGLIAAVVPILNNVFMFFSVEIYRRWYYMLLLIMALASAKVLEEPERYRLRGAFFCLSALYCIYWGMLHLVRWDAWNNGLVLRSGEYYFGLLTGVGGMLLTMGVMKWGRVLRKRLLCVLTALYSGVVLAAVIYGYQFTTDNTNLDFKTYSNTYGENVYNYLAEIPGMLDRDVLPYRYYFNENTGYTYYNLAMTNSLPSINSFISTIHSSIEEFYERIGVGRVNKTYAEDTGTRELLSARYIVSVVEMKKYTLIRELTNSNGQTMYLYENENALPIGFTYDSYITRSEFEKVDKGLRPTAMLGTLVVRDEDVEKLGGELAHYPREDLTVLSEKQRDGFIADRRKECSSSFVQGNNNFESRITADSEKYAFFSVPYDRYWKASVNGREQEILNINGLMAVKVWEGENVISFEYCYAPLKYGILLSIAGIGMCVLYIVFNRMNMEKKMSK